MKMIIRSIQVVLVIELLMFGVVNLNALDMGNPIPMPKYQMKNVDGSQVSLNKLQGKKGTLVMFVCNSCPWVKAWQQRITDLGNTYVEQGIGIAMINSNDPARNDEDGFAEMQRRAEKYDFHFPYLVDSTSNLARAFGATHTPEAYLFDSEGELVYHGAVDDNAHDPNHVENEFLKNALESVVNMDSVEVNQTKALGCTIKFRDLK